MQVYKTLVGKGQMAAGMQNHWVLDGAATINLSNGSNFMPGTKHSKSTIIEVVGRTHIECTEVADFKID